MRQIYQMTAEDHAALLDACKPTPAMYLSGGIPMGGTPQENANAAWQRLGEKMGFDHMTVRPIAGYPETHFSAEAKLDLDLAKGRYPYGGFSPHVQFQEDNE